MRKVNMGRTNVLTSVYSVAVLACLSASTVEGAALHAPDGGVVARSELPMQASPARLVLLAPQALPPGVRSAGPSGRSLDYVLVYHNTNPRFFYTADVDGTWVGDDITLDGAVHVISEYRVGAYGHGDGPYVVTSNLAYDIDGATASVIAGSECVFEVPGGAGLVDLFCTLDPPLIVPDSLYALFECDDYENGAWLVSDEAEVGFTEDDFCVEVAPSPGLGYWGGGLWSGFEWSVWADPDCNDNDIRDEVEEPDIESVCSLREHEGYGEFCLELGGAGPEDDYTWIEPRLGGVRELVVQLSVPLEPATVVAGSVEISCDTGAYDGTVGVALEDGQSCPDSKLVITLEDGFALPTSRCRVSLSGISSIYGLPAIADFPLNVLECDGNRDGIVNSIDFSGNRARWGETADETNFIWDYNHNGSLNTIDSSATKARFGNRLPDWP